LDFFCREKIKGKISGVHGSNGVVRAIFETGLPGQAINNKCGDKLKWH